MKVKVIFRADASSSIGMGHFIRTLALADMLKNDFYCIYATQTPTKYQICEIEKICHELISLPVDETHYNVFLNYLKGDEIVVLDNYYFTTDDQLAIKLKGCKLVCIDDLHDKEFVADLIINHALGVKPEDYSAQSYTQFALGLDYALIRHAFLDQAQKNREIGKIKTLFICFGGSDYKNITKITLELSLEFKEFIKIIVVTGSEFKTTDDFDRLVSSDIRVDYRNSLNENEMLNAMLEAELAIVPASGILLEILASGCITISGVYIDNQKYLYTNFLFNKLIIAASDFNIADIKKAINIAFRSKYKQHKYIDGFSAKRIKTLFFDMISTLREANINDCELLFNWANDSEVRKNAVSNKPIAWESHFKWFSLKLASEKSKIFILETNGIPSGQIRYDLLDNEWVIDYSISDKMRGKGLGKIIIKLSLKYFNKESIKALVHEKNVSSFFVFKALGFLQKGSLNINSKIYYEFILKL
jgi:UDP-2,4-diacetamido-2,4,6-trideoxy-beta-L-altropyranose hydrolase